MGLETMTIRGFATLTIENASDDSIRVIGVRQVKVEFGERTTLPAHCEMRCELVTLDFDDDFFEQRPEQLLAIAG
jgi:hypothetical protein